LRLDNRRIKMGNFVADSPGIQTLQLGFESGLIGNSLQAPPQLVGALRAPRFCWGARKACWALGLIYNLNVRILNAVI
jgi:hypothetical protein